MVVDMWQNIKFKDMWPDFHIEDDEICIANTGNSGMRKVRTNYVYHDEFSIFVDHEHRPLEMTEQQQEVDSDPDQEEEIPAN